MPTTTVNALPYPDLDTPAQPDVPADFQALALAVDRKLVTEFANAAARDAAVTSPVDGRGLYYLADVDQFTARVNGAWVQVPVANSTWQDPAVGTAGLRSIGAGAQQAAAGTTTTTVTAAEARDLATPGHPCPGMVTSSLTLTGTFQDAVAAPATNHCRLVKGILTVAPSGGATVTMALGGTTLTGLGLNSSAQFGGKFAMVLNAGEAFQLKSTASMRATVSYVDYLAAAYPVGRAGFATGSGSGTLITSAGADRLLTQVVLGNTGTVDATITLSVGGSALPALTIPGSGVGSVRNVAVPSGSTVTYVGDGVTAVAMVATAITL